MQFKLATTMRCWFSCASGICLAFSDVMHTCTASRRSCGLFGTTLGRALCGIRFSLSGCFSAVVLLLLFCLPPTTPLFCLFPLLSQCDGCPDVPVWRFMAELRGFASHGSVLLSTGWLITVEALDIPDTQLPLSSMQLLNIIKLKKKENL